MAMYDWNGNGDKNDSFDNFMDYQICGDSTRNSNASGHKSNDASSKGGLWIFLIIVVVASLINQGLGVLLLLVYGWLKLMGM